MKGMGRNLFHNPPGLRNKIKYNQRVIEDVGLKVELHMMFYFNKSGALYLEKNWNVGGNTNYMKTKQFFLRDLNNEGILDVKQVKGDDNPVDIFIKKLPKQKFNKFARKFCGNDEYHSKKGRLLDMCKNHQVLIMKM